MRRPKLGEALFYPRRSGSKQELGWKGQVTWAQQRAKELGVQLVIPDDFDLDTLSKKGLHQFGNVYFDSNISGGNLDRPGFQAMLDRARFDMRISHVLIHKRDRAARPASAVDGVFFEHNLAKSGVTIVYDDDVVTASPEGMTDFGQVMKAVQKFQASRDFLENLAERVIAAQRDLATDGFSTGGMPPYGFGRFLVDPEGRVVEELKPKRTVREYGHHVRVLPKDPEKIAIWIYILDLKHQGWGTKRIAKHLNDLGIPSPDAGRIRHDHGVPHEVSGKWNHNTVAELCRNSAILGLKEFCRRAEGAYRRHDTYGPRKLDDRDRAENNRPVVRVTDPSVRIRAKTGGEAKYDPARWQEIQLQMDERSKKQRGIPRSSDPTRYPLATRVVDLTEGCGSIMYGTTHQAKRVHKCGRYLKTGECNHNVADAEALLRFVLGELRESIQRFGGRCALRARLEKLASSDDALPPAPRQQKIDLLEQRVKQLEVEKKICVGRMAREVRDVQYEALANELETMASQLSEAERELNAEKALCPPQMARDAQVDVEAALRLLDHVEVVAGDPTARAQIQPLLQQLGIWVGLNFGEARKGKRPVRRLLGGLISFGGYRLPVPLHGRDNRDPSNAQPGPGRPHIEQGTARDRASGNPTQPAQGDPAETPWVPDGSRHREGVSLTKVNRGDRI